MASLFVDSSALVKRYRQEDGSHRVSELLESADRLLIARLTIVEVSSALVRRARAKTSPENDLAIALAAFDDELRKSFEIVELDEPVIMQAVALVRKHGLRGADAIQLACALLARNGATQQEFIVLGSDQELNAAASAEALSVLDPTKP